MKFGTENKKKTIAAIALLAVALLLFVRMMVAPSSSISSPASPPKPAPTAASQEALANQENPAAANRRTRRDTGGRQERRLSAVLQPTLDPRLRLDLLKSSEDVKYAGTGRNIFNPQSAPEIPKPVQSASTGKTAPPPPQGPPPPPPINLKFFGYASRGGESKSIFLAQGDSVFTAHEGDIVAGRYRVLKINPTSVQIQDVLSNNTQTIPLTQG